MKKAIFTLAIGDNPMYRAALNSFKIYADRVGADLIVSDELHYKIDICKPKYDANPAWSEKLYIGELLKEYDRVLYLDADFIITPSARDIFEVYPDTDTVYMFNEGLYRDRTPVIDEICRQLESVEDWQQRDGKLTYFNMGMLLVSKQSPLLSLMKLSDLQSLCNSIKFYEQTYTNYIIQKHKIKYVEADSCFNRMDLLGNEGYQEADFIHYAGRGFSPKSRQREIKYIADYCQMFADIVDPKELESLNSSVWELYLSKLNKKYKLPKPLLNWYFSNFSSKP